MMYQMLEIYNSKKRDIKFGLKINITTKIIKHSYN